MPAAHGDCSPGVALDVVGDMSVRPGACPSGWGPSTPSGTEILSPDAQDVPARNDVHPAEWNVPVHKRREVGQRRQKCGRQR